ncbi:MAG: hypothetical protein ABEI11_03365 [Haloarculaceae archaeon]
MSRASDPDPGKRIPKSLGTDTSLIGSYSLSDLVVAGVPGVAIILVVQTLLPSGATVHGVRLSLLTIPLAVVGFAVGGLFVYLTPAHASSVEWLGQFVGFHTKATELSHDGVKAHAPLERVHPADGMIERSDGALVGVIRVSPPTMALTTDDEWAAKTEAFQDFLNTTVEFPIQIYSTTREFPVEAYLDHYEERLSDPDVESNDRLAALIDHYTDWYGQELGQRQMTIRDHYVLVPVRPAEATRDEERLLDDLTALPIVGVLVRAWTAPPREQERAAMRATLADRLRRVERGLRTIDGCETSSVDATELTRVVAEYWTGSEFDYDDPEQVLRTSPVVASSEA